MLSTALLTRFPLLLILSFVLNIMASTSSDLPRWDLSRFGFETPFDKKIDEQLEAIKEKSKDFKDTFEGHLVDKSLLEAVTAYERIASQLGLIGSYLSLSYDVDLENDKLKKRKGVSCDYAQKCKFIII